MNTRSKFVQAEFMVIGSLQMQQNINMNMQQQQLNLTLFPTPFNYENASQFSDPDLMYPFDGTIEGADNYSDLYCPSFSCQNITYLNVSCETAVNFAVPLYGESTVTIIHLIRTKVDAN